MTGGWRTICTASRWSGCPRVFSGSCGARLRLQLAKVYWAIADYPAARHLLREIDDIVLHRLALGALGQEVSEFRRIVTSNA